LVIDEDEKEYDEMFNENNTNEVGSLREQENEYNSS
jgi:hypothetical protein